MGCEAKFEKKIDLDERKRREMRRMFRSIKQGVAIYREELSDELLTSIEEMRFDGWKELGFFFGGLCFFILMMFALAVGLFSVFMVKILYEESIPWSMIVRSYWFWIMVFSLIMGSILIGLSSWTRKQNSRWFTQGKRLITYCEEDWAYLSELVGRLESEKCEHEFKASGGEILQRVNELVRHNTAMCCERANLLVENGKLQQEKTDLLEQNYKLRQENVDLKNKIAQLEGEEQLLRDSITALRRDRLARNRRKRGW